MIKLVAAGPGISVQDAGRPGYMAQGLSRGGAMDPSALAEAAALLGVWGAAIEMLGGGMTIELTQDGQIALTGGVRRAVLNDQPLGWLAAHPVRAGDRVVIAAGDGAAYLSHRGGILTEPVLGSRSCHGTAGLGQPLSQGMTVPHGPASPSAAVGLPPRHLSGVVRVVAGPQTDDFDQETRDRFFGTTFRRSAKGNRQGVQLEHAGAGFEAAGQLTRVSDFITVGDIQLTGAGIPYVLMAECQTIGGYPRIGTVIEQDLPLIVQAPVSAELRFQMIALQEAEALWQSPAALCRAYGRQVQPLLRDPAQMTDLLSYQLVSGFITGDEEWL